MMLQWLFPRTVASCHNTKPQCPLGIFISKSSTTVEIGPGEVRDVLPELSKDWLQQFTAMTASGSGVTAELLLNTSFGLFPYRHAINQIHTPGENFNF